MPAMMWKGVECFAECCIEPVLTGWLCRKHYQRVTIHNKLESDVRMLPRHLIGTKEGFMTRVEKVSSGCWLWTGALNNSGYGSYYLKEYKKSIGAHRASHFLFHGELPSHLEVDHKYVSQGCPRHCVNPEHLRLVSSGQNNENAVGSREPSSGHRNIRITVSGKYQARIKKNGKEFSFPPTKDLSEAIEQAKKLRMQHFTHNTFERNL